MEMKQQVQPRSKKAACESCNCPLISLCGANDSKIVHTWYRRGQHIFDQGEPTTGLHVLCKGAVMVFACNERGDEYGLHVVGPASIIAMTDILLEEKCYSVTAKVVSDALVAFVRMDEFRTHCENNSLFTRYVMRETVRQMQLLEQRHGHLAHDNACGRMLHLLRHLIELGGRPCGEGLSLPITLKRSALASLIATRPETISRLTSLFQEAGLARFSDKEIVIPNPDRIKGAKCCH